MDQVEKNLTDSGVKFSLSSMIDQAAYTEAIYELGVSGQNREKITVLKTLPGIRSVSLVDCRKG